MFRLVFTLFFKLKSRKNPMMTKILAAVVIFASNFCAASEADNQTYNEILHKIEANKNTCVSSRSEDRIYLNPDRIFPTEEGLYLNLNDVDYVHLPILSSDRNGCYIPCVQIFNICPGCGYEYFVRCTRPDCPLVQRKLDREREQASAKKERKREKGKKSRL